MAQFSGIKKRKKRNFRLKKGAKNQKNHLPVSYILDRFFFLSENDRFNQPDVDYPRMVIN